MDARDEGLAVRDEGLSSVLNWDLFESVWAACVSRPVPVFDRALFHWLEAFLRRDHISYSAAVVNPVDTLIQWVDQRLRLGGEGACLGA